MSRDSQRSRLYAAENFAELDTFQRQLWAPLDGTLEDAQRFVDRVVRSRWWKANASANQRTAATIGVLVIAGDRGQGGAWAQGRTIKLGAKPRRHQGGGVCPAPIASPVVILHELAHVGSVHHTRHGPEFARLELALLRRFLGPEVADAFRAAFLARKVRHRRPPKPGARRPGNPEALAAFRPTSDGEWVVGCEVSLPRGSEVSGIRGTGEGPVEVWALNYGTARGLERLTPTRGKARVWKNQATAERWAERFAREEGGWATAWRVEPLLIPEARVACQEPEPRDLPPELETYNEPEPCPVCKRVDGHRDGCVLGE